MAGIWVGFSNAAITAIFLVIYHSRLYNVRVAPSMAPRETRPCHARGGAGAHHDRRSEPKGGRKF